MPIAKMCSACEVIHEGPCSREAARTKLLMKFWAAMQATGFHKSQEWEAQEKISVESLKQLLLTPPKPERAGRGDTGSK